MFLKNKILITVFLLIILFNILVLSVFSNYSVLGSPLSSVAIKVFAPVQKGVNSLVLGLSDIIDKYIFTLSLLEENKFLKKELESKNKLINNYSEVLNTNSQLRSLLELKQKITENVIAADIIAYDTSVISNAVIINKGAEDGIVEKSPVIVNSGIMGLVTDVTGRYSRVLLITDPRSSVDVFIKRKKIRGIVEGSGNGFCSLKYVSKNAINDVRVGDLVISSGLDGVFPKGMVVGTVSKLIHFESGGFKNIHIDPCINISAIQNVLVIVSNYTF